MNKGIGGGSPELLAHLICGMRRGASEQFSKGIEQLRVASTARGTGALLALPNGSITAALYPMPPSCPFPLPKPTRTSRRLP